MSVFYLIKSFSGEYVRATITLGHNLLFSILTLLEVKRSPFIFWFSWFWGTAQQILKEIKFPGVMLFSPCKSFHIQPTQLRGGGVTSCFYLLPRCSHATSTAVRAIISLFRHSGITKERNVISGRWRRGKTKNSYIRKRNPITSIRIKNCWLYSNH
jgi:hypothetical protein